MPMGRSSALPQGTLMAWLRRLMGNAEKGEPDDGGMSSLISDRARTVRMPTEIGLLQPMRQVGFRSRRLEDDMALRQRIHAVGDRKRLLDPLFDQQHRGARIAQLGQDR